MNWNPLKRERDLFDILHLLITIAIAVGGFMINQKQAELNRKFEREKAVQTFSDKIFEHLEQFKLNPAEKEAMVIDLLDIITESNISETGELSDTERRQLMPLRIALVTENDEILSHIGAAAEKRALWVKFAEFSGSAKVKLTAIHALEKLGRYGGKEGQNSDLMFSLSKILSISKDFSDLHSKASATQALSNLVEIMDYEATRGIISSSKTDSLVFFKTYEFLFEERSNIKLAMNNVLNGQHDSLQTMLVKTDKATAKLANLLKIPLVEETEETSRTVAADTVVINQVTQLTSEDVSQRKSARVKLASSGRNAVEPLLKSLQNEDTKNKYLVRLGVAKALYLMKQPVAIHDADDVAVVVDLIGDPRSEIRTDAAEFLMKLSDQQTVNLVYKKLQTIIREKKNGNAVYNAAVILGTWYRILPTAKPTKAEIKNFLVNTKTALTSNGKGWNKTITVIDELSSKSERR